MASNFLHLAPGEWACELVAVPYASADDEAAHRTIIIDLLLAIIEQQQPTEEKGE